MPVPASWPRAPPCLLLTLLLGLPGGAGQELRVIQPEESVSVAAGETATLRCTLSSISPIGPTLWFRGTGPGRELVYDFRAGGHSPRVTAVGDTMRRNNTDFSVRISDITTGDYYCVKFRKGNPNVEIVSGTGIQLTVSGARTSTVSLLGTPLLLLLLGWKLCALIVLSTVLVLRRHLSPRRTDPQGALAVMSAAAIPAPPALSASSDMSNTACPLPAPAAPGGREMPAWEGQQGQGSSRALPREEAAVDILNPRTRDPAETGQTHACRSETTRTGS